MADLILYLGITALGYFAGSKMRDIRGKLTWTGKVQTIAITVLVLLMGMRMGSNEEITENLSTIGLSALVFTIITVALSVAAITITRKFFGLDRYGRFVKTTAKIRNKEDEKNERALEKIEDEVENLAEKEAEEEENHGISSMTIYILVAVVVGMLLGYFVIRNSFAGNIETFDKGAGLGIKIGLCILLGFVGIDLGLEGTVIENFKKVGLRILIFPVAVIMGTLVGAMISGLVLGLSMKESLSIGAGFGWYTLAPGIIMEAGFLKASAISFLHNVMRELSAILLIPLVAKKVGYIETTGMPGAAAMDVCLPIVEKSTRGDIAVYSFVSGVVLSFIVPVLVPLFIGM